MASATDRSQFLFKPEVRERLDGLYELASRYLFANQQAGRANAPEDVDYPQIAHDTAIELTERFRNLHSLFGDEMKLG